VCYPFLFLFSPSCVIDLSFIRRSCGVRSLIFSSLPHSPKKNFWLHYPSSLTECAAILASMSQQGGWAPPASSPLRRISRPAPTVEKEGLHHHTKRYRMLPYQRRRLLQVFESVPYPPRSLRDDLAQELCITPKQVQVIHAALLRPCSVLSVDFPSVSFFSLFSCIETMPREHSYTLSFFSFF